LSVRYRIPTHNIGEMAPEMVQKVRAAIRDE